MFGLGIPELLLLILAFGILFFGGSKVLDFSRALGRASGEFKKGKQEIEKELSADKTTTPSNTTSSSEEV
jgi:sec-independent protein translocase protein TatA